MRFNDKKLEIVVKAAANGDFSVESNSRESFRVLRTLKAVVAAMDLEINRQRGRLVLAQDHTGHFERSIA